MNKQVERRCVVSEEKTVLESVNTYEVERRQFIVKSHFRTKGETVEDKLSKLMLRDVKESMSKKDVVEEK